MLVHCVYFVFFTVGGRVGCETVGFVETEIEKSIVSRERDQTDQPGSANVWFKGVNAIRNSSFML